MLGTVGGALSPVGTQARAQQRLVVHEFLSFYLILGPSVHLPLLGDLVSAASELAIPIRGAGCYAVGRRHA